MEEAKKKKKSITALQVPGAGLEEWFSELG